MDDAPLPGTRIADRYTLQREVGHGGMSFVFRAHDDRYDRPVAVKFLRPQVSESLGAKRFLREIQVAAKLNHPHIVGLLDSGEADGRLYYVMPYVEGATLASVLKEEGPLPLERALGIARDVGEALAYAHDRGVIHRDVKPGNIMLASGHAVVTDFGVAKALDEAVGYQTSAGVLIGTPGYMAPEQAGTNDDVDARADTYALGCVTYEMLTGEPPFSARSVRGMVTRQVTERPPSASKLRPELPESVTEAVERAMARLPETRFETVTDFVEALEVPRTPSIFSLLPDRLRPKTARSRRWATVGGASVVVAAGAALLAPWLLRPTPGSWPGGRPPSVVVLPSDVPGSTEEEGALAARVAADVTSELGYWEGVRAVPAVSLSGPMFDRGIQGPTVPGVQDAVAIAVDLGVAGVVLVTAELRGDSARVTAALFDASSGLFRPFPHPVGRTTEANDLRSRTTELAEPIARRILGLSDEPFASLAAVRRRSRNPDALRQAEEGRRHLERWELADAERAFRSAVELDSAFALAHLRLAQTLYWQGVESPLSPARVEEVAGASAAALRLENDLLPRADRDHIRAFHAFQEGDYRQARARYEQILSRDSTDVYAWLLLGSVEYTDPWLTDASPDARPRGSWNRAATAFFESVRLQPTFQLGYGQVFRIYDRVARAVDRRACPGLRIPRGVNIPPWESVPLSDLRPFCPVALDSITWIPFDSMPTLDAEAVESGTRALLQKAHSDLVRWSLYDPDLPRPLEELTRLSLRQRSRYETAAPELLDSLATEALATFEKALGLKRDTVPEDLFKLATLTLGTGAFDEGVSYAESALESLERGAGGADRAPEVAVNPFLATGQVVRALELLGPSPSRRSIRDPETGEFISYGGAQSHVRRARVLGAAMVGGPPLRGEIQQILSLWSSSDYTERHRELLQRNATREVMLPLAFDDEAMDAWGRVPGFEDPLWRAVFAVGTEAPDRDRVVGELLSTEVTAPNMTESFLSAQLALRVGRPNTALRLLNRIDSIPLGLDIERNRVEFGWGLRPSSLFLRGQAYAEVGDTANAVDYYERYTEAVAGSDSLTEPLRQRALRALEAMRR